MYPVKVRWIHVDIWQNQYNIVKLKNKIKKKRKEQEEKKKSQVEFARLQLQQIQVIANIT